jgi:hypothetical protein
LVLLGRICTYSSLREMRKTPSICLKVVVALLVLAAPAVAIAETSEMGDLPIPIHGSISPVKLPRNRLAPIGFQLGLKLPCRNPGCPRLSGLRLDLSRHVAVDTEGLARCPLGVLRRSSKRRAHELCASAEVGHGNVTMVVPSSEAEDEWAPVHERLTAFNGRVAGRRSMLLYGPSNQSPGARLVIVFVIAKTTGTYGTRIAVGLPAIAGGRGYISAVDLALKRRYVANGKRHSFLAASCPLPSGINIGGFKFGRLTEEFEGGIELVTAIERNCKAGG